MSDEYVGLGVLAALVLIWLWPTLKRAVVEGKLDRLFEALAGSALVAYIPTALVMGVIKLISGRVPDAGTHWVVGVLIAAGIVPWVYQSGRNGQSGTGPREL